MSNYLKRSYLKEEEFLDEFCDVAASASDLMGDEWHPHSECDDNERHQRRYFLGTGELKHLAFESASVYSGRDGRFSSAQIVLKSSDRVVTVKVSQIGDDLVAEKVVDRPTTADDK